MRPSASTMLQQNNNNNYPCLNVSASPGEMPHKCSRASLPLPGRLELGLGDLPLIRGLRAWALCSKNRRKAGSPLGGGGHAPTAPHPGRGASTSCPRPADVYLSPEWGRMGYGLPLGVDARQAGIGALVTVASLKTSEGGGKTQTQCLLLRTEKGNCLYSTAKPGAGVVGGWLRGKTGGGRGGSKDNGPSPPAQTGANWARVRSARRWRKSGHAASREKTSASRESQQRSGEDPAGKSSLEERQEEPDKEGPDGGASPSPQQSGGRCCHSASTACNRCEGGAQGKETPDENDGGESPRRGASDESSCDWKGMRKEGQQNEEEEGAPDKSPSCCSVEAESSTDLHSDRTNRDSHIGESQGGGQRDKELQTSQKDDSFPDRSVVSNRGAQTLTTANDVTCPRWRPFSDHSKSTCGDGGGDERRDDEAAHVNGFSDYAKATFNQEDAGGVQDPEGPPLFRCLPPNCVSSSDSSLPTGGSTHLEPCWVQNELQSSRSPPAGRRQEAEGDSGVCRSEGQEETSAAENTVKEISQPPFICEDETTGERLEEGGLFSPARHQDGSVSETDSCETRQSEPGGEQQNMNPEPRADPGHTWGRESAHNEPGGGYHEGVKGGEAAGKEWRVQESRDVGGDWRKEEVEEEEDGDTCGPANIVHIKTNGESGTGVPVDPCIPYSLLLDKPAPTPPPLEFMATSLDCLEVEKEEEEEEEEEESRATAGDKEGDQEGGSSEPEQPTSTVATQGGKPEEEEEDEFGVFMQAQGEPDWSEAFTTSASVPCGSRNAAPGDGSEESSHWTSGWTVGSSHLSDDSWAAFPQDSLDDGGDAVDQWWPSGAVEERRDGLSTNHNLAAIFAEAFPSLPVPSSCDSCDLNTVPTLMQLLRGRARQDQGLLDNFHDLNKMIGRRYKRASGVSRDLLLRALRLEPPHIESHPALWTSNRRLSPGLPSANHHGQNAAAKRRLSYDYNRNVME